MGVSQEIAAGAVICGAYFGDKMTPLSETTILVPQLVGGGLTTGEHIRNMFWTAGPGARDQPRDLPDHRAVGATRAARSAPTRRSTRSRAPSTSRAVNLLPLALLVVFTVRKVPPFLAILGSALFAGILACFTQWDGGEGVRRRPGARARSRPAVKAVYGAMATGFVSHSGVERDRRALLPRRDGEPADDRLARAGRDGVRGDPRARRASSSGCCGRSSTRARSRGQLILAVNASGDRPQRDRRRPVRRRRPARAGCSARSSSGAGLAPQVLSRAVEDSGTVTSPLVPWNTCGAYMSGVLGRVDGVVSAVLLLQPAEPGARRRLRLPRLQGAEKDAASGHMIVLTGYAAASASLHSAVTLSRSLRTVSACARTPSPSNKPPNASMYALAQPAAALPLA